MADNSKRDSRRKPLAETVVGILSAVLVFAFVIFLAYQAITGDRSPPDLVAIPETALRQEGKTLLRVKIVNRGERAAADVTVRAEMPKGPGREIRFDYVAAGSSQSGAFLFDSPDVAAEDIRLSIYGFVEP